jgi:SAM-dependent methyltransferase
MTHRATIRDQFTRQAVPFSTAPGIMDDAALRLLVEQAGAGTGDTVLDVACGPGLVVAAFATVVSRATGIDVTPAMIDRARALVAERKLANVGWLVGDACPLPFPDASFSIVSCRFAFHHFLEPRRVLAEMARVCRPGGRIVVTDLAASSDPAKAAALNRMEKLRDPSHVCALPLAELEALFTTSGLPAPRVASYGLESDVEGLLSRSFPDPGNVAELRRMFADSIADDAMGLGVRRQGERIRFAYPVAILTATRA